MSDIRFEWDAAKANSNVKKHAITFEEARSVFLDERAILIAHPDHSGPEERFVLLGLSLQARVLTVCHCERKGGDIIRIFSARKATKEEQKTYFARLIP